MSDTITLSGGEDTITISDTIADDLYANVTLNSGAVSGTISYPWAGISNVSNVYTTGAGTGYPWATVTAVTAATTTPTITVKGEAKFEDDIIVKGRSLTEALDRIEERLKIVPQLKFDPELEKRWEDLKALGDKYRELEAEILEGEKAWAILNR